MTVLCEGITMIYMKKKHRSRNYKETCACRKWWYRAIAVFVDDGGIEL